jgi:hypothetical protein
MESGGIMAIAGGKKEKEAPKDAKGGKDKGKAKGGKDAKEEPAPVVDPVIQEGWPAPRRC